MNSENGETTLQSSCSEAAFAKIMSDNKKPLRAFLTKKYGHAVSVCDVVQEAFVRLWTNRHCVQRLEAKGFLFTVANHLALNEISRSKTAAVFASRQPAQDRVESVEETLTRQEQFDTLHTAMGRLSQAQRQTLVMNRWEGKSHQEIAAQLGISRKAVEKRIYTALDKLKANVHA